MAVRDLADPIEVEVSFRGGVVRPKRLLWHGRGIDVVSVVLVYEAHEGATPLLCFSLQSETAVYGVEWNRVTNVWRLVEATAGI